MSKKDEEYWILKLMQIVKDNINTKLTSIQSEKGDGIVLDSVNSNAFYYATTGETLPNYGTWIVFDASVMRGDTNAQMVSTRIRLLTQLCFANKMLSSDDNLKRVSRYRRALSDLMTEKLNMVKSLKVLDMPAIPFAEKNQNFFALGVTYEIDIT